MSSSHPLVSIICFTRNAQATIERCIESVLSQDYPAVQFVVQDGASTDGSLDILRKYGERIDLLSEQDQGVGDAFLRAMARCRGEIIGSCLSDEEFFPGAVSAAVEQFRLHPHVGAIIGAARNVDLCSQNFQDIFPELFDLSRVLSRAYVPHLVASFFKRSALLEVGIFSQDFQRDAFETEIWGRLGSAYEVRSFPVLLAKYAIHSQQLSHRPRQMLGTLKARLAAINQLFGAGGSFEGLEKFLPWLHAKHIADDVHHLKNFVAQLPEQTRPGFCEVLVELEEMQRNTLHNLKTSSLSLRDRETWALRMYRKVAHVTPSTVRSALPSHIRTKVRDVLGCFGAPAMAEEEAAEGAQTAFAFDLAMKLQERGDVDAALRILHGLDFAKHIRIDSMAMQVAIKSPLCGNQELMDISTRWAQRHASFPWIRPGRPASANGAKVRVGYAGAFWSAEYMRYQLLPALRVHDRQRFSIVGICHSSNPLDTVCPEPEVFDEWIDLSNAEGGEFVSRLRSLRLDILVEVTGYSPGHRFVELAQRCALVQISYINHNSTSGTPNVDYILADRNAAPEGLDKFFTEKIWRLPVPFFCFSYEGVTTPPIADPPVFQTGQVTFGYFGSGPKLNLRMIELWARLLSAVPESRLYIRNNELRLEGSRDILRARFARFGIGRDRLRLEKGLPWKLLLEEYNHVDISLDTWPYNGGNTISESLWQGVPVITLRGDTMPSRYGASMLLDLGWDGLVADTEEQYIECAVRLAKNQELLRMMRHNLRRVSTTGGFRDTRRFTAALESAYCEMLDRLDKSDV